MKGTNMVNALSNNVESVVRHNVKPFTKPFATFYPHDEGGSWVFKCAKNVLWIPDSLIDQRASISAGRIVLKLVDLK
jgi:hypothetical protein